MGEVKITVKEGEKDVERVLKDEDVAKLVKEHGEISAKAAALEGKVTKTKAVDEFMAKHGLQPDEFVSNVDGAFTLISKLIDEQVIDTSGKVLGKGKSKEEPPKGKEDPTEALFGKAKPADLTTDEKVAAQVAKALEPILKPFARTLDEVTTVQTGMLRGQWEDKIQKAYPNLTTDDVKRVFSEAAVKPKVAIMDIAKGTSEAKSTAMAALRAEHAKEFGVNIEQFDANKLQEQGSGGGAATMFQGKKFTLSARRMATDKNFVDPTAASKEYLKKKGIIR